MDIQIKTISMKDLDRILSFTDKWIGKNYFTKEELRQTLLMGIKKNINTSLLAEYGNEIIAVRITLAPGEWITSHTYNITPHAWPVSEDKVAYFKCLFIDERFQGRGLGKILSNKSIEQLKKVGTQAIVCHSWVESPNNSSHKYLEKIGFKKIITHANFWYFKEYECTRCGVGRCECSAEEMVLFLKET